MLWLPAFQMERTNFFFFFFLYITSWERVTRLIRSPSEGARLFWYCHSLPRFDATTAPFTFLVRFLFYSACPCIPMPRECASVCRCWLSWRRRALHVTMYFQPDFILSSRLTERRVSSFLSFFFQGMSTEEEGSTWSQQVDLARAANGAPWVFAFPSSLYWWALVQDANFGFFFFVRLLYRQVAGLHRNGEEVDLGSAVDCLRRRDYTELGARSISYRLPDLTETRGLLWLCYE